MQILPINIVKAPIQTRNHNVQNVNIVEPTYSASVYNQKLPNFGLSRVAFLGNYRNEDLNFKNQLLSLDDIHCPCCGNLMLSQNKYNELVQRVNKISSLKEYSAFLTQNKKYFQPKFEHYVNFTEWFVNKNPDKTITDLHRIQRSKTSSYLMKTFKKEANYLEDLLVGYKFSEADKVKINKCKEYLNSLERIPKALDLKNILKQTIAELEHDNKWDIYTKVKTNILDIYTLHSMLQFNASESRGLNEHAYLVKRMLGTSVNSHERLYDKVDDTLRVNNLLVCQGCKPKYSTIKCLSLQNNGYENFTKYVMDIANAINKNKLQGNSVYLYDFTRALKKLTSGKLFISRQNFPSAVQDKIFKEIKSNYIFENYERIPCACCGTETITHQQKLEIFEEIKNCENLHELKNVANLYYNNFTQKGKIIFDRFARLLEFNPNISEENLFKILNYLSKEDIKQEMLHIDSQIKEYVKTHSVRTFDRVLIGNFLAKIKDKYHFYPQELLFGYDEYDKIIFDTLNNIPNPDRRFLVKIAKLNIKQLYLQDALVNPQENVIQKAGGKAKAMLQNIFKLSVLTVDHIDAKTNGGGDNYSNKIGYCKDCNNAKSGIVFPSWASMHPEINENLPKHLKKIMEIIKEEGLKDMQDYPLKVLRTSINLSKGVLDPNLLRMFKG